MIGTWERPLGKTAAHYLLKPRDAKLAMRSGACGQIFVIGTEKREAKRRCKRCERVLNKALEP